MVQLHILSGKRSGTKFDARHLPLRVGRSEPADLILEDAGVWAAHLKIFSDNDGLILETEIDALTMVNGTPQTRAVMRNGDLITIGEVTLRFGLTPTRQSRAALREWLTWIGLALVCAAQIAVIYWLGV